MGFEDLKNAVQQLEDSLKEMDSVDESLRDKLTQLIAEINQNIDSTSDQDPKNLSEKVKSSVIQFEANHPRITELLEKIKKICIGLGI